MGDLGPFGSDPGWRTPSGRLWRMRVWEALGTGVILALLIGGAVMTTSVGAGLAVLVGILLVSVASLWFLHRRFRAWRYLERAEDLVVVRGVMLRRLSVVPYGRMQYVDVTAGPVERLFGLATVKLHTAAAASDARVPGLEPAEAARLRDQLARLGEAKAAGL
ncbi:MAG: PH domain-containing protein [Acidimicrobiales bacterium]